MRANEKLTEVLNDLIQINNDRFKAYKKAAEQSKELDTILPLIFNNMANDSIKYADELKEEVKKSGGMPSTDTTAKGKIYRVWMDIKATFSGTDRQSILESCEFGEDTIQKTYSEALASDALVNDHIRTIISKQKAYLKTAHKLIKNYRDAHWKKNNGLVAGFS